MAFGRDIWIVARFAGLASLGLAGVLWIVYMAIAPAAESELETVEGIVTQRWLNRHKSRVTSQGIRVVKSDGDELRVTLPYTGRDNRKIEIERDMRVTLKITDYGNVYAVEGRRGTLLAYQDGRDWYASRRIIPGILATTVSLLAVLFALVSFFGPMVFERESEYAQR